VDHARLRAVLEEQKTFSHGLDPERPSSFKKWLQIRSPAQGMATPTQRQFFK